MLPAWTKEKKDEQGKKKRKRAGEKEAKEAEEVAREMGVWDEFYGSGKATEKKDKKKKKGGKKVSFGFLTFSFVLCFGSAEVELE